MAIDWHGRDALNLNNTAFLGPPVEIAGSIYVGIREAGGPGDTIFRSSDGGETWTNRRANIRIGDDRYNLLANPEETGLWAIKSECFELPGSLWESIDHGDNWTRVDDGSFPPETVRVIVDSDDSSVAWALTPHGLFVSENRGVRWQATSQAAPVHGLAFVTSPEVTGRLLVVGTDTGIQASADNGHSWKEFSQGLINIPHTVAYANGILLATSAAGYFTCNTLDCLGAPQLTKPAAERGLVDLIEFYNTDLKHYFITPSAEEAAGIDAGAAGPGWVRTGETFTAWDPLANDEVINACRFYGSVDPGPNSHFFSTSPTECRMLMNLQESNPASEPRWNFENYPFAAMPASPALAEPCPAGTIPVYRAYNDAFRRGEDSNHRYVIDESLLDPMVVEGWVKEGVAFCVPEQPM